LQRKYIFFQNSYKIKAQLVAVVDFSPLLRSAVDIVNSKTNFYGFIYENCLAAVIEIEIEIEIDEKHLDIHSLIVEPKYFRKGLADKLINHVLNSFEISNATVKTAAVNKPAINLYKKHGFIEFKR
jgi:ribosomal protein S18 acetylase RimI-like enzyme